MTIVYGDITDTEYDDDVPSERIRFALEAMQWFEQTPGYNVNMCTWRDYTPGSPECFACCGGAARACKQKYIIDEIDEPTNDYERSLNHARNGMLGLTFDSMNLDSNIGKKFIRHITPYIYDQKGFYTDMNKLADDLQAAGY